MRKIATLLASTSLLLTSACGAIRHDLQHPGGYPGYLLDRHSFNASSSKELILLRATIVLAMAARMGQATMRGEDADAFALSLSAAAREINFAAADLYPIGTKSPCNISTIDPAATASLSIADQAACDGYRVNFESEVPLIEARLIKTVVAALPTDKARQFLDAVAKGDVLGAALKGLGTFGSLAAGLHYANGSFRSGLEIVATQECNKGYDQNTATVANAVQCLDLPTDSIFSPTDKSNTHVARVSPTAFAALMRIANSACTALPYLKPGGANAPAAAGSKLADSSERDKACGTIWFAPLPRGVTSAPTPAPTPTGTPTPAL